MKNPTEYTAKRSSLWADIFFRIPAVRKYAEKQWQSIRKDYALNMQRAYAAALTNRFTQDFIEGSDNINKDIREGQVPVRKRARTLWRNNDYVRGIRNRYQANMVGPNGFKLQARVKTKSGVDDITANQIIEAGWEEFRQREYFTMSGQWSGLEASWLWSDQWVRDGEVVIRMILNAPNKFGFSLELLDSDLLDETYNARLNNGNVIIQGIEFTEWSKPVAYYFRRNTMEDELNRSQFYANYPYNTNSYGERTRVPAEEIIFWIDREHAHQKRGISHLVQSLLTFHDMEGYDKAAIIAARAGATLFGTIETDPSYQAQYNGEVNSNGDKIETFEYGEIKELPAGKKLNMLDPAYPHEQYPFFKKSVLRQLAVGVALAYANWTGDLEAVNFSSMRSGLVDERDSWLLNQSKMKIGVEDIVYKNWLKYALMYGALTDGRTKLNFYEYERLVKHQFLGRGWQWIDPEKDINASVKAIDNNLSTLTDELNKTGKDYDEVISTRKKELADMVEIYELKKKAGLVDAKVLNAESTGGGNGMKSAFSGADMADN